MTTYIITDPSYILTRDEWSKCCEILNTDKPYSEVQEQFNLEIQMYLKDISKDPRAYSSDTLIGDWTNSVHGPNVIQSEFCADAGMVCVVEYTEEIQRRIGIHNDGKPLPEFCYALFEAEGPLTINSEEIGGQLQLYITDNNNHEWTLDNPEEEEYDD